MEDEFDIDFSQFELRRNPNQSSMPYENYSPPQTPVSDNGWPPQMSSGIRNPLPTQWSPPPKTNPSFPMTTDPRGRPPSFPMTTEPRERPPSFPMTSEPIRRPPSPTESVSDRMTQMMLSSHSPPRTRRQVQPPNGHPNEPFPQRRRSPSPIRHQRNPPPPDFVTDRLTNRMLAPPDSPPSPRPLNSPTYGNDPRQRRTSPPAWTKQNRHPDSPRHPTGPQPGYPPQRHNPHDSRQHSQPPSEMKHHFPPYQYNPREPRQHPPPQRQDSRDSRRRSPSPRQYQMEERHPHTARYYPREQRQRTPSPRQYPLHDRFPTSPRHPIEQRRRSPSPRMYQNQHIRRPPSPRRYQNMPTQNPQSPEYNQRQSRQRSPSPQMVTRQDPHRKPSIEYRTVPRPPTPPQRHNSERADEPDYDYHHSEKVNFDTSPQTANRRYMSESSGDDVTLPRRHQRRKPSPHRRQRQNPISPPRSQQRQHSQSLAPMPPPLPKQNLEENRNRRQNTNNRNNTSQYPSHGRHPPEKIKDFLPYDHRSPTTPMPDYENDPRCSFIPRPDYH